MTTIPNSLSAATRLVWFITGTSQGFGNQLVRAALQRGDCVVATSRQPERVAASFSESADRLLAITLDLRGDPALAAEAIIRAVTAEKPPLHPLLGKMAYERVNAKLDAMKQEFAAWRKVTLATDFQS